LIILDIYFIEIISPVGDLQCFLLSNTQKLRVHNIWTQTINGISDALSLVSLVSFGSLVSSEVNDVDSEEVSVAEAALQSYLSKNINKKKIIIII
jgi:hypothetical protein